MSTAELLLPSLKIDLGISTDAYDERLGHYIINAQQQIEREGITLTNSESDNQLIIMYAAWTWRRRDSGEGMPRMLRYALNNRVFSEKMQNG